MKLTDSNWLLPCRDVAHKQQMLDLALAAGCTLWAERCYSDSHLFISGSPEGEMMAFSDEATTPKITEEYYRDMVAAYSFTKGPEFIN
ncbi:hypothetical protein [Hymenobacter glacieicola]|uniref:Uncharacterized protein n=1 Tax=Hymenobacter glacieicola TaxID=1562124 RepID=A0ABQ1X9V3_9BACT|nr:hypothetical protein [Hymenobacter glacieicola]GGG60930.1 hypothetical protein GCM10011378_41160 [Hymenobacter glacieicola]